jgi:RND family efflux transporter MFP subunit
MNLDVTNGRQATGSRWSRCVQRRTSSLPSASRRQKPGALSREGLVDLKTTILGLILATAGAGCTATPHQTGVDEPAINVTIGRVAEADLLRTFEAGGVVRARSTALIASRVMAPILQVHVRPGDTVRRGAALVTLDAREIEANASRADAASRSAAESARAAAADVNAAQSASVLARATHDRMAGLYARRSATAQELDQAVAALAAAEAQQASAQARLAAAGAASEAAQASAKAAAVNATYEELSSPFDGVVTQRRADPGTMAVPGMPLLTVEDPSTCRLEVQLDESRAGVVSIGRPVSVRFDSASESAAPKGDRWIDGRVAEIERVDPSSHAFLVKIDVPSSTLVRSGLFGRARIGGAAERALMAPTSALLKRGQLTLVYVVEDGRARLRPVSPGSSDGNRTEVFAGLREGDQVVTDPPQSLRDGARISGGQQ